ncbi:MAG: aldehyde ferredoxin oxidoreductase family protein [Candidatus Tectomicrobia bacterium]|nr:aldehyde ferredoxin oxidoreductase family protein [Candidatus Tectomicrobia bacterium]
MSNKIAWVNLATREVRIEEIPEEWRRKYIGGRGINQYLLFQLVDNSTEPLGPENPLIVGAGALSGVLGIANCRVNFSAKSPETGHLGDSSMGGFFASELRQAGFDHIVFTERAEEPIYVTVRDGAICFHAAAHLADTNAISIQDRIREELGDPRVQVAAIGPAGRNKVVWACILNGSSDAAGRTGMGAVMGSKNIWAIAARGTKPLQVHDPAKLLEVTNRQYTQVTTTKGFLATSVYGTLIRLNNTRTQGYEGGHNHQFNMMEEGGEELDSDIFLERYESAKTSCFNCPTHCRHHYEIKEGPFAGTKGGSMEYYGAGGWGSQCGSGDWNTILVAFARCNEWGLDVGSATAYTGWLMELWEKGILTREHTDLDFTWGNQEAIFGILEQTTFRKGFGNLVADGWMKTAAYLGNDAGRYIDHVKGLTIEPDDVRGHRAQALGLATSSRGADHLRSRYTLEEFSLPPQVTAKLTGRAIPASAESYEGKEWACFWTESLCAVADALGICKFLTKWLSAGLLGFDEFSEWLGAASGLKLTAQEILEVGERIYNVERLFLVRHGFRRKDDDVPLKFYHAWTHGPRAGTRVEPEHFQPLLERYYELHGWDSDGVPTEATLQRLGIDLRIEASATV